jgi:3-hydroxy-9,10-secoandrosta-1,3,5(10)-triene-9,17-dione monooxygenase reductase component
MTFLQARKGSSMAFDERQFRDALGLFATGVAVVTAEVDGVRLATTVSSFNAVSLSPPLVLFSIARKAGSFALWQSADSFAVMVLDERQRDLSTRFAKPGGDKWQNIDPVRGASGAPLLPAWHACFECEVYARYPGGDHEIIVGEVIDLRSSASQEAGPLVFYRGRYHALTVDGGPVPDAMDMWLHGW